MGDDEEVATLESQFAMFAMMFDAHRTGETITLYRSDYWMRQAKLLDDRKLTMTDTGISFNKFSKTELDWDEWNEYLGDLCEANGLNEILVKESLTNCGNPGQYSVIVPEYRDFFLTWKRRDQLIQHTATRHTTCFSAGPQLRLERQPSNTALRLALVTPPEEVYDVAETTRHIEIAGFLLSLITLAISFFIFSRFRSLQNYRTRIHRNLFGAMLMQVYIRLTLYVDQAIVRYNGDDHWYEGIEGVPSLCKFLYVLLEYAITVMFQWMLIEGIYLYKMVSAKALRTEVPFPVYHIIGWGFPLVLTAVWAALTAYSFRNEPITTKCWYGYNFGYIYWLLQVPRIFVIVVNFIFRIKILRSLITKLREGVSNDIEIIKKATRAALVLLPLLGITNALNMKEPPMTVVWKLAVWSYITHFFRSFQGFFIALIYCFCNVEVRTVIYKHYSDWAIMRADNIARRARNSFYIHKRSMQRARGENPTAESKEEIPMTTFSRIPEDTPLPPRRKCYFSDEPGPSVPKELKVDPECPADHKEVTTVADVYRHQEKEPCDDFDIDTSDLEDEVFEPREPREPREPSEPRCNSADSSAVYYGVVLDN